METKKNYSWFKLDGISVPGSLLDMTEGGKKIADVTITSVVSDTSDTYGITHHNSVVNISFKEEIGDMLEKLEDHTFRVESKHVSHMFYKGGHITELTKTSAEITEMLITGQEEDKKEVKEEDKKLVEDEMKTKIIISTDSKKVVEAKILDEELKTLAIGSSKCHPSDKFSFEEGTKQALKRAFKNLKKDEYKESLVLFYKDVSYGTTGKPTKFVDSFTMEHLCVGDQVQVLREGKSVKGVIADGLILTNDEILKEGKAFITLLKKYKDVEQGSIFSGVMYKK